MLAILAIAVYHEAQITFARFVLLCWTEVTGSYNYCIILLWSKTQVLSRWYEKQFDSRGGCVTSYLGHAQWVDMIVNASIIILYLHFVHFV